MNPPASILFIDSARGIGGAELSLIELVAHLDRDRFRPCFLGSEGPLIEHFDRIGVTVQVGSFPFFSRRRPWVYARAVWDIVSLIRRTNISLVHVNCDRAVPHAVRACRLVRVPVLCHVHDMTRAWFLPSYVKHLNRSSRIIADSKATARHCLAAGMSAAKLQVIYECFNSGDYMNVPAGARQKLRQRWGLYDHHVAIGLVGQVLRYKGHETFIRAAHRVVSRFDAARFIIVGDDALSDEPEFLLEMKSLVKQLGLEKYLFFAGFHHDVPAVMAALDVVTVPSWKEPFGRVVVEALASQRPVVASQSGGIPEIVDDGQTGLLVAPEDVGAWGEALLRLCQDADLRQQMGKRGPASAQRFDIEPHARLFERTYDAVLMGNTESLPRVPFGEPSWSTEVTL